jgi:hypothetical protein
MSESTLSVTQAELGTAIAYYLGWGRTTIDVLPIERENIANDILKRALRRFYFPINPRTGRFHNWSFLKPLASMTTGIAGTTDASTTGTTVTDTGSGFTDYMVGATITFTASENTYTIESITSTGEVEVTETLATADAAADLAFTVTNYSTHQLPDDFASMWGKMTYTERTAYEPVVIVGEQILREHQQRADQYGRPCYAAVRPLGGVGTAGQRFVIDFWPIPDARYTMQYRYAILADTLTTNQYPYGGAAHAQTILQACRAEAELHMNDQPGPEDAHFQALLMTSIAMDNQQQADYHGYMGEGTERHSRWRQDFIVQLEE